MAKLNYRDIDSVGFYAADTFDRMGELCYCTANVADGIGLNSYADSGVSISTTVDELACNLVSLAQKVENLSAEFAKFREAAKAPTSSVRRLSRADLQTLK